MQWRSSVFLRLMETRLFVLLKHFRSILLNEKRRQLKRSKNQKETVHERELQMEKLQQEKGLHLAKLNQEKEIQWTS